MSPLFSLLEIMIQNGEKEVISNKPELLPREIENTRVNIKLKYM